VSGGGGKPASGRFTSSRGRRRRSLVPWRERPFGVSPPIENRRPRPIDRLYCRDPGSDVRRTERGRRLIDQYRGCHSTPHHPAPVFSTLLHSIGFDSRSIRSSKVIAPPQAPSTNGRDHPHTHWINDNRLNCGPTDLLDRRTIHEHDNGLPGVFSTRLSETHACDEPVR
jgi:hypothetical protein